MTTLFWAHGGVGGGGGLGSGVQIYETSYQIMTMNIVLKNRPVFYLNHFSFPLVIAVLSEAFYFNLPKSDPKKTKCK